MIMAITHNEAQYIRVLALLMLKIPRQKLEQRFSEEGVDLTMMQHHIMNMAQRHQLTIADMSRTMGVDPSTLVPIVDALVKKGYIERKRDPEDRRRYPLHVTDEGEKLHHHICTHLGEDPLHQALLTLNNEDVEHLARILEQVVKAMPDGEAALQEMFDTFGNPRDADSDA